LKKRRKAERGRPRRKREGASSRSIATTSDDRALQESAGKTVGFQAIITDITERKRTEEALRVSEEKYRRLFETMMQGVVYQDSNGRIVSANPAAERILGLTLDQMQGRTSTDPRWKAIHEDGSDFPGETHPSMIALKTGKEVRNVAMGVFNPNSEEYRWVNINAVPQFEPGETKPFQAYTTFEDITERKRMEEEIRGLARFPSENPNPVLRLNNGGTILVANPASKLLLQEWGAEVGQVAPKFWRDLAADVLSTGEGRDVDVEFGGKSYTFLVKPIMEAGYVNLYGRDITERKQMQDELQRYSAHLEELVFERTKKLAESEKRFRELADLLPQIVYEADVKGNLLFLNQAGLDAHGYSREELARGLNVSQLFVSGDVDRGFENIRRRLSGEKFEGVEYTLLRKDGTTFPVLIYSAPIVREGRAVGLRGVVVDITERKRTEIELRAAKERLGYVVTSNPAVIFTAKPRADYSDYNIAYMSDRVVEMLGFEPRQFIGHPEFWDAHVHPDDLRRYPTEVPKLWKKGQLAFEYRFLHKDGTYRWIREEAKVIRDADGKPVEVMGYWTDVTELKQIEDALQVRERQLFSIYSNVSDVLFLLSVEPDDRFRFLSINQTFLDSTGLRENQVVGRDVREIIPEPSLSLVLEKYRQAIRDKKTMNWEEATDYPTGRKIGEVTVTPIPDANGHCTRLVGAVHDITERRQMEARLVEAQRLAAIGETTAMVGHDLRNPLQAIVSTVYLAKRELESQIEPSKKPAVKPGLVAMLETIENESQYMNKIVSDLQDYATPLKAEPKPVQMESLVRDTLLKIRIPQNVKVSFKVSEALQTVTVDPAVMRRVFSNLIMNAIQAMPNGGELAIDLSRTEEHLLVSFRDTGVGIPEENLGKLFNPFFTTKSKGQGLGLPVCKKLVEACDGRITVESKPGEGSTFTVKLPLVKP